MQTPQPIIDLPHITQRVVAYYYSYGTVQQLNNKAIPSIENIKNMVPAAVRQFYNYEAGRTYYGGSATLLEVMDTLDPQQQKKWFNDYVFQYVINYIDAMNIGPTDNLHETMFYVYSSSRFGGFQNAESRRQFNPVAGLGVRDCSIQQNRRALVQRNYDTNIQENLNDSLERGCINYKQDMSTLMGRKNY
jgi:hypothetical protein